MFYLRSSKLGSPVDLAILVFPDESLSRVADPVTEDEFGTQSVSLVERMTQMLKTAGGVGLAAPQVGVPRRVVVVRPLRDFVSLINPAVVGRSSEEWDDYEGCLSLPGMRVQVSRSHRVRVDYREPDGASKNRWFEGFEARIVQHEIDHLDGVLLFSRIKSRQQRRWFKRRYEENLKRMLLSGEVVAG